MAPLKDVLQGLVAMLLVLMVPRILVEVWALEFQYHDQANIASLMKYWSQKFPNSSRVYSIGKSVKGQDLWVIAIDQNPSQHSLLVPNVKYIGNMHGNEVVGREMFLQLAEHLLENYSRNETLARFFNMTRVHIMPTMNPDGFELSIKGQCKSVTGSYLVYHTGGMQDYMYVNGSGYKILIEISRCKYPEVDQLEGFWESNPDALINLMLAVNMGIKGLILCQSSGNDTLFEPLEGAKYTVKCRESVVFRSIKSGEYYKLLLPGEYFLQVSYPGFNPAEVPLSVQDSVVTRKDIKPFIGNLVFHKIVTKTKAETAETSSSQLNRCLAVIISFSTAAVITPLFFL